MTASYPSPHSDTCLYCLIRGTWKLAVTGLVAALLIGLLVLNAFALENLSPATIPQITISFSAVTGTLSTGQLPLTGSFRSIYVGSVFLDSLFVNTLNSTSGYVNVQGGLTLSSSYSGTAAPPINALFANEVIKASATEADCTATPPNYVASMNVSCIRNSTGTYTFYFTRAMPNTSYRVGVTLYSTSASGNCYPDNGPTTTAFSIRCTNSLGVIADMTQVSVTVSGSQ